MTHNEHLLILLSEECDEVSQRALKALRFGLSEIQKEQPLTNEERIIYELNDLMAVVELLQEVDALPVNLFDRQKIHDKKLKVAKYLKYSQELGVVESNRP